MVTQASSDVSALKLPATCSSVVRYWVGPLIVAYLTCLHLQYRVPSEQLQIMLCHVLDALAAEHPIAVKGGQLSPLLIEMVSDVTNELAKVSEQFT